MCAEYLEHINLRGCDALGDAAVVALSEFCPRLNSIVLEGCSSVTSNGVAKLLENAVALTHLNVAWCKVRRQRGSLCGVAVGCRAFF